MLNLWWFDPLWSALYKTAGILVLLIQTRIFMTNHGVNGQPESSLSGTWTPTDCSNEGPKVTSLIRLTLTTNVMISSVSDTSGFLMKYSRRLECLQESTNLLLRTTKGGRRPSVGGHSRPLQEVGGHEAVVAAHSALVDHGAVVRHLYGLADAGLAALHDA